ncbi:hypothetical protein FDECE_16880 [Fusarium decemcellulare]|nr:hypothetical protein FDECE_16880 [Fusarium decemcellulare]
MLAGRVPPSAVPRVPIDAHQGLKRRGLPTIKEWLATPYLCLLGSLLWLSDEWADAGPPVDGVQGALGSWMHLKQNHPHLRVVLLIGGGNSSEVFPMVASDTLPRDKFARSARGLVEASGLDGIDIAWEYPCDAQQGYDFLAPLTAVRTHLPKEHYILTAAMPKTKAIIQLIDLKVIVDYLDFLNLMAYDFFGAWTSNAGHHAQLYGMNEERLRDQQGFLISCLMIFLQKRSCSVSPTYGRSFPHCAGAGRKFKGTGSGEDGTFEYSQLPRRWCKEVVDKRHVAAQCEGGNGGLVTYDNPETVKIKADFCKQKGLGILDTAEFQCVSSYGSLQATFLVVVLGLLLIVLWQGLFYSNGVADSSEKSRSLAVAVFRAS